MTLLSTPPHSLMMTISLVISIVCIIMFLIFSLLLCGILIKRKREECKKDEDIEKCDNQEPPTRKRRRRSEVIVDEDNKNLQVPFNSPDPSKQKKKEFQPMNYTEKKRRKKEKRLKRRDTRRIKRMSSSCAADEAEAGIQMCRPRVEYFNSKVEVSPLNFSDTNYTRNHVTDTLFAGSIHRGYSKVGSN